MDLKTKLVYQWAKTRIKAIESYSKQAQEIQLRQLKRLLGRTERTEFGRRYGITRALTYREFAERTPVQSYEEVKADVDRMIRGERDVLIPGGCRWYAKSSGTTNDKSKYIPVPYTHLHDCHYRGGGDALWLYLRNYPDSRFFSTKGLVLGGSHAPIDLSSSSTAGDLSAILVQHMPALGSMLRVPSTKTLLMDEWGEKMRAIVREVSSANVGSLSGVPSWMMVMLKEVLAYTGAQHISEVWPNLEVFFHGGISFEPYREAYRSLIANDAMRYEETYNASEGFIAIQDEPSERGMLLMLDYGTFYEFVPVEAIDESADPICDPTAPIPLWEVEAGRNYAILMTTLGGLHRYLIGDTIQFTSLNPYRIIITGRTKHFINAFGEELMVANADRAIARASYETGSQVAEYTAAPHFFMEEGKGRHDWLVEFATRPADINDFARILDEELQKLNSDYEAKRYMDMTLRPLHLTEAPRGLFHRWLDEQGKLGGQHKIPRLANHRRHLEELLAMMSQDAPLDAPQSTESAEPIPTND